ncbi:hypothetical protein ACJZ2D_002950 [Fusarium nematophilum]
MHLLGDGMRCDINDPALIFFFYPACSQGTVSYLEKLLQVGASRNTPPVNKDFATPLQAAVKSGSESLFSLQCTEACIGTCDYVFNVTCVASAWGIRQALVEAGGVDEHKLVLLLTRASEQGSLQLCKLLLERGIRLEKMRKTGSMEVAELRIDHGSIISPIVAQAYAMAGGRLEPLRYLVGRDRWRLLEATLEELSSQPSRGTMLTH